jgi:glycosyltransferase involved in cell wall biosynthesis
MIEQYGVEAIRDVPTGVDTDFFRPNGNTRSDPHGIVFTGSMDWLPNEDAIRYFTARILPQIRERIPDATLTVVGRNPYPGLVELSQKDPGITVTGRVDDVRPYMERAAVYVVPLRIGGGTRLKIYEAMAMEKPMVSTTVGAEGLPLEHGVELLIADTPDLFADSVIKLLTDGVAAREMAERAARMVREKFGWKEVAQRFAEICEETVRRHREKTSLPQS